MRVENLLAESKGAAREIPLAERRKSLVLAIGGIGDVLMTIPLMRGLASRGVVFDVCVYGSAIREVLCFEEQRWELLVNVEDSSSWRELWRVCRSGYHACYMNHVDGGRRIVLVPFLAGIPVRAAGRPKSRWLQLFLTDMYSREPEGQRPHRTDWNLRMLHSSGDNEHSYRIPSLAELEKIDERLGIHPGSDNAYPEGLRKRWPAAKFAALCGRLINQGQKAHKIKVFLGPKEEDLASAFGGLGVDIIKGRDLAEVCRIIASCSHFVSNDSGLAHIAYSAGLKPVVLFGWSEPEHTGPLDCYPVRNASDVAQIRVDDVIACLAASCTRFHAPPRRGSLEGSEGW